MRDAPLQPPGLPSARQLTLDALAQLVGEGTVETVVAVIPDMYGRLMGKRFTARFFLDEVAAHGMEACNYLLGCDIEMDPQPGYRITSWQAGYGDFVATPALRPHHPAGRTGGRVAAPHPPAPGRAGARPRL
jgi:glutamine synthetase